MPPPTTATRAVAGLLGVAARVKCAEYANSAAIAVKYLHFIVVASLYKMGMMMCERIYSKRYMVSVQPLLGVNAGSRLAKCYLSVIKKGVWQRCSSSSSSVVV